MIRKNPRGDPTDLASFPRTSADASEFSEDVARTNNSLVLGYKTIQNELRAAMNDIAPDTLVAQPFDGTGIGGLFDEVIHDA